jgi:hypothetical protein
MPFPTDTKILEMMKKDYEPAVPMASKAPFELAEAVSVKLSKAGIDKDGAIAVATSATTKGRVYVAFSPNVQEQLFGNKGRGTKGKYVGFQSLEAELKVHLGVKEVVVAGAVEQEIHDLSQKQKEANPGCAEKKLMTALKANKESRKAPWGLVAHPVGTLLPEGVCAHVVIATSEEAIIGPCNSCKAVALAHWPK